MPGKSILIIGAGIAGLSAGCYGQMNGYSTRIFELNTLPGGLCTSWTRRGFTFDGCIHWLIGTKEKTDFPPDLGGIGRFEWKENRRP